jgi:protein-S-isoprenylcysteine O-methyltransferase Ste14
VQSLPALGAWTGLMTVPFAAYLVVLVTNLPSSLVDGLSELLAPFLLVEKAFVVGGLAVLVFAVVHLRRQGKEGLVTSGPYRVVRHPQYFGIILSTTGLTSWSVWVLTHTFGMGFLTASQTTYVWVAELLAYVFLAVVEELFLAKKHGTAYAAYRSHVPFLVPFLNTRRKLFDVLVSIAVFPLLLGLLITIHPA